MPWSQLLYPPVRYRGRFAPSPSGPLHFGSLIAALGSWLDARSHGGEWLVRIEDIDPPRQQPGADRLILQQLEAHGLTWDRQPLYQSQRSAAYQQLLDQLQQQGLLYVCRCRRNQIKAQGGHQGAACRALANPLPGALRFANLNPVERFDDLLLGPIPVAPALASEDMVVKRSDGLWGYPLAVVADDLAQGISHVVRGADLVEATASQLALIGALGAQPPAYGHLPLAVVAPGLKLSKQNHAPAIEAARASANLDAALCFLGLPPPPSLTGAPVAELLAWAVSHYQRARLPAVREQPLAH